MFCVELAECWPDAVCVASTAIACGGCCCQAKQLQWKLTTRRRDGAGDFFREKHTDLSDEELARQEQHLAAQVHLRQGQAPVGRKDRTRCLATD